MMRLPSSYVPSVAGQSGGSTGYTAPQVDVTQVDAGRDIMRAGERLSAAGGSMLRLAERTQDRYDTAVVKMGAADLTEAAMETETAFGKLRGIEAQEAYPGALKPLQDKIDSVASKLQNPRQRDAFSLQAKLQLAETKARVAAHYERQARDAEFAASASRAETSRRARTFAFVAGDTEAANSHQEALVSEIRAMGQAAGAKPETIELNVTKALSGMHSDAVTALVNEGQGSLARGYLEFAKTSGELTDDDFLKLDGMTRRASASEAGLGVSFKIRESVDKSLPGGTTSEKQAKAIADAEAAYRGQQITYDEYQATVGHLQTFYGQQRETERAMSVEVVDRGKQWFMSDGNQQKTWEQFTTEQPELAAKIDGLNRRDDFLAFLENGNRVVTDWKARLEVERMDPGELAKLSVVELQDRYGMRLSARDFEVLLARRNSGLGKSTQKSLSLVTNTSIARAAFTRMYEKANDVSVDRLPDNRRRKFEADFDRWVDAFEVERLQPWQEKNNTVATPNDLRQLLAEYEADIVNVDGREVALSLVARPGNMPKDVRDTIMVRGPNGLEPLSTMPEQFVWKNPSGEWEDSSIAKLAVGLEKSLKRTPTTQEIFSHWYRIGAPKAQVVPSETSAASPAVRPPDRTAAQSVWYFR